MEGCVYAKPVAVAVETSATQRFTQFYQTEGQALPDRDTILRTETSCDTSEVFVVRGQDASVGDVIARIDQTDKHAEQVLSGKINFTDAKVIPVLVELLCSPSRTRGGQDS